MVYQILSIVIKIKSNFITYILRVLFKPFSYISHHTLHIICISLLCYCDLCWSICCYLLYSFSEERCIFQGGGLTSTILCKGIIHYQTLKLQSRKVKKLQRDDRFKMKNKSWNCRISLNLGSRVVLFRIRISWNKSEQKQQL